MSSSFIFSKYCGSKSALLSFLCTLLILCLLCPANSTKNWRVPRPSPRSRQHASVQVGSEEPSVSGTNGRSPDDLIPSSSQKANVPSFKQRIPPAFTSSKSGASNPSPPEPGPSPEQRQQTATRSADWTPCDDNDVVSAKGGREQCLLDLVSEEPTDGAAWLAVGKLHDEAGSSDDAEMAYNNALNLLEAPILLSECHILLGVIANSKGLLKDSESHFRAAAELTPEDPKPLLNLVVIRHRQGDISGAMLAAREAVDADPSFYASHANLGVLLQQSGEFEEAAEAYERAIELRPDYTDALYNLGTLRMQMGQPLRAVEKLATSCAAYVQNSGDRAPPPRVASALALSALSLLNAAAGIAPALHTSSACMPQWSRCQHDKTALHPPRTLPGQAPQEPDSRFWRVASQVTLDVARIEATHNFTAVSSEMWAKFAIVFGLQAVQSSVGSSGLAHLALAEAFLHTGRLRNSAEAMQAASSSLPSQQYRFVADIAESISAFQQTAQADSNIEWASNHEFSLYPASLSSRSIADFDAASGGRWGCSRGTRLSFLQEEKAHILMLGVRPLVINTTKGQAQITLDPAVSAMSSSGMPSLVLLPEGDEEQHEAGHLVSDAVASAGHADSVAVHTVPAGWFSTNSTSALFVARRWVSSLPDAGPVHVFAARSPGACRTAITIAKDSHLVQSVTCALDIAVPPPILTEATSVDLLQLPQPTSLLQSMSLAAANKVAEMAGMVLLDVHMDEAVWVKSSEQNSPIEQQQVEKMWSQGFAFRADTWRCMSPHHHSLVAPIDEWLRKIARDNGDVTATTSSILEWAKGVQHFGSHSKAKKKKGKKNGKPGQHRSKRGKASHGAINKITIGNVAIQVG